MKLGLCKGIAVGRDGTVYFTNDKIAGRVTPEGRIFHLTAGSDRPLDPHAVSVAADGTVLLTDVNGRKILAIAPDGSTSTFAGTGQFDGNATPQTRGASRSFAIQAPLDARVVADGSVAIIEAGSRQAILRADSAFPPMRTNVATVVPSADGALAYVFERGRHTRTVSALTGVTLESLEYDGSGHLLRVTDQDGLTTNVVRNAAGEPIAILAPNSQRTDLTLVNGQLASVTPPGGSGYAFRYSPAGLLSQLTDRRGGLHTFAYDDDGLLLQDTDPAGGFIRLARIGTASAFTVKRTSAESRVQSYATAIDSAGTELMTHTASDGTQSISTRYGAARSFVTPLMGVLSTSTSDPRFGMAAPLVDTVVTTGSKTLRTRQTRAVTLGDPGNVLSLRKSRMRRSSMTKHGRRRMTPLRGRLRPSVPRGVRRRWS